MIQNEPFVVDVMEEVRKERQRLEGLVNGPDYKKNAYNWSWMKDWLENSDEENCIKWHDNSCNVCGERHRFFLKMKFSFCDEYPCGLQICGDCMPKLQRIFVEGVGKIIGENPCRKCLDSYTCNVRCDTYLLWEDGKKPGE